MTDRDLLAIVAAIVYAGDGLEAAVISATINAEDGPEWSRPEAVKKRDDASPRLEPAEAVAVAIELIVASNGEAWKVTDR